MKYQMQNNTARLKRHEKIKTNWISFECEELWISSKDEEKKQMLE